MNDPHVKALYYDIGTGSDRIVFGDPKDVTFENNIGHFELANCKLIVTPANHYADEKSARNIVDPFIKSWELYTDLTANLGQLRITFKNSEIVDRNPLPPGGNHIAKLPSASLVLVGEAVATLITCGKYPDPPANFRTSTEIEIAHMRWARFRDGKDSLQSASYFVLTLLETTAGGRKAASKKYGIPFRTLNRIAELSSTRGTAETARKAKFQEMTGEESSWLEKAIRDLIIQLGRH